MALYSFNIDLLATSGGIEPFQRQRNIDKINSDMVTFLNMLF